jgi:hypothetical protein
MAEILLCEFQKKPKKKTPIYESCIFKHEISPTVTEAESQVEVTSRSHKSESQVGVTSRSHKSESESDLDTDDTFSRM